MTRLTQALIIVLAWTGFVAAGPRFLSEDWMGGLTILGMVLTFVVLSRHGPLRRKDPLALSSTGRRPYFEMR